VAGENSGNQPNSSGDKKPSEPITVEELRDQFKTDPATFAGVRVREGWAVGALTTSAKYQKAVEAFLNGPTALEQPDQGGE
jgi:hypothetical protein